MDSNFLELARQARKEDNAKEAAKYYAKVREEDPKSVEAKFFAPYYALQAATVAGLPNRFVEYVKVVPGCLDLIKEMPVSDEEKIALLKTIIDIHAEQPHKISLMAWQIQMGEPDTYDIDDIFLIKDEGVKSLVEVGDKIALLFGKSSKAMELAANCWKAVFADKALLERFDYVCCANKKEAPAKRQELIQKIQEVDPSFEPPKAKGCGSK